MGNRITIERNIKQDDSSKKYFVTLYYKNANGTRVRDFKTVDTLKEARKLRDDHEAAVRLNIKEKSERKLTLSECIDEFINHSVIEKTTIYAYKNIKSHIDQHYIAKKKITELKKNDILDYINYEKKNTTLSNATINKHLILIGSALNNAYQNELISENVMNKVKKLEVRNGFKGDYYTIEECKALFAALETEDDCRLTIPVYLAVYCGFRRGEVCGLRWQDVDFANKQLHICITRTQAGKDYVTKAPKTMGSDRLIKLNEDSYCVLDYLKACKAEQMEMQKILQEEYHQSDLVLTDKYGKPVRPNYLSDLYKSFLKKYDLRHIRFHDLRHPYVKLKTKKYLSLFPKNEPHSEKGSCMRLISDYMTDSNMSLTL